MKRVIDLQFVKAFWLDVLIGEGLLVRKWDGESGDYRYFPLREEQASKQVH